MENRTITLPADLVARFEMIADLQGRPIDEMLADLIGTYTPIVGGNWALAVAEGMEAAKIDWIDDPDASTTSRQHFNQYLDEKRKRTLNTGSVDA